MIVITLSTQVSFSIFDFNNWRFSIVSLSVKLATGVYVKTKKSLVSYVWFVSLKYLRSGSPSSKSASDDASKLKFLDW